MFAYLSVRGKVTPCKSSRRNPPPPFRTWLIGHRAASKPTWPSTNCHEEDFKSGWCARLDVHLTSADCLYKSSQTGGMATKKASWAHMNSQDRSSMGRGDLFGQTTGCSMHTQAGAMHTRHEPRATNWATPVTCAKYGNYFGISRQQILVFDSLNWKRHHYLWGKVWTRHEQNCSLSEFELRKLNSIFVLVFW